MDSKNIKDHKSLEATETIPKIGKWDWDLENGIINWSDDLFRIFGIEPQSIIPTLDRGLAFIYADDREIAETAYRKAITYGEEYCIEKRIVKADGGIVVVLSIGTVLKDKEGKIIRLLDIFQDITETKKIADALEQTVEDIKARNQFIETVIESIPIGIAVNKIDDGKATLVNKRFSATYGWNEDDFTDVEAFFNKIYPDEAYRREITTQIINDILSGDPDRMKWNNIRITTSTGEKRVINAKNIPLFEQNLMISTVIDVTQAATQAAEIYRIKTNQESLINGTEDLIWSVDKNLRIITSNKAYREMVKMVTHKEPQEGDFVMAEDFGEELNKKWEAYYQRVLNGERFEVREQVFHLLSQRMEYSLTTFNPMFNEYGELFGAACYSKDITDETNNLKALEKTKAELEKIMDYSLDMICRVDAGGIILSVSAASKAILGYAPDELIGKPLFDFIYPEDLEKTLGMAARVMAGEEMIHNENRYVRKDGSLVYLTWSARWDPKEKIRYGIARDATEMKRNEQALEVAYGEKNTILESIGDAFFAVDRNWIVTYWNNHAEKVLMIAKNEIVGKSLWNVFSDSINSESYKKYHEALETNEVIHFEDYYEALNTWHEISAYPSESGLSVYFKDITERKLIEHRLRAERNLLRTLIDNLPHSVYFKDKDARKLISNKVDYELLGVQAESEVLGKTDLDILPPAIAAVGYEQDNIILDTGIPLLDYEHSYLTKNGIWAWFLTTKIPLFDEKNETIGLLGIGRDITEQKLAEKKLKELNTELEKNIKQLIVSNAELEQFAYVASHDLQEPLRMVTSFLTQLEKKYGDVVDDKGRQYIHFAVDGAKRMRQIILDLLDFSRVGHTEDDLEEVDFNKLLNEILALYRRQIEELHAKINFGNLPVAQTYKTPVRQVLQNLVSNSLKYQKAGVPAIISISCEETKTHYQFSVQDNGIGIAPEYFDKIFIIFQRLHNKDEYSGTGMGLAISKKIIENLGGKIWVESEEGKGSIFYFTLPKNKK